MLVYKRAVGDFPATPAPDETWRLAHNDPPPVGEEVEICFTRRKTPDSPVEYQITTGTLKERSRDEWGHTWLNKYGLVVVFNPDFWRELCG